MKINRNKYRIKEKIYKDGHKEYIAQYAIRFLFFFTIWRNYYTETYDYGYAKVNFICSGHTYNECKEYLLETIKKKEIEQKKKKIDKINYLEL